MRLALCRNEIAGVSGHCGELGLVIVIARDIVSLGGHGQIEWKSGFN